MTQLAKLLFGTNSSIVGSGTLTGSGTLEIPAGVTSVTLTGAGGVGGDNYWYDPGRPKIDPSGYHPAVSAAPASGSFTLTGGPTLTGGSYTNLEWNLFAGWVHTSTEETRPTIPGGWSLSTVVGTVGTTTWAQPTYPHLEYVVWWTLTSYTPAVAAADAYYSDPGQSYLPPSSGGGDYAGPSTTASLNGATRTWVGGTGAAVGGSSTQVLTSTGAGQTLTYSVGAGGNLSYSYF